MNNDRRETTDQLPAVRGDARPIAQITPWTPSFVLSTEIAKQRVEAKRAFYKDVMEEGRHFGTIPGTSKPTLYKPGAELLLGNMGLSVDIVDDREPLLDFDGRDHNNEPLIAYWRKAKIYRQIGPTEFERVLVAALSGSCNSWETKYRYRFAERTCPKCDAPTIRHSKGEDEDGWYCWRRIGGCGETFEENDAAITGQKLGKVPNDAIPDLDNTVLKIADKRALVASTLVATGCSDIFTQDLEDDDRRNRQPPAAAANGAQKTDADKTPKKLDADALSALAAGEKNRSEMVAAIGKSLGFRSTSYTGEQMAKIVTEIATVLEAAERPLRDVSDGEILTYWKRKAGQSEPAPRAAATEERAGAAPPGLIAEIAGKMRAAEIPDDSAETQQLAAVVSLEFEQPTTYDWRKLTAPAMTEFWARLSRGRAAAAK